MYGLNSSEKKYIDRLMIALCLLQNKVAEHRNQYEIERQRCKNYNEEYIVPRHVLGTLTKLNNETLKLTDKLVKKFNDLEFDGSKRNSRVNGVIDKIYEQIELDKNEDKKDGVTAVANVDDEKDSPWLPPLFCDTWCCAYFSFRYILKQLSPTLNKFDLDISKIKSLTESYHKFFIREIMACRG